MHSFIPDECTDARVDMNGTLETEEMRLWLIKFVEQINYFYSSISVVFTLPSIDRVSFRTGSLLRTHDICLSISSDYLSPSQFLIPLLLLVLSPINNLSWLAKNSRKRSNYSICIITTVCKEPQSLGLQNGGQNKLHFYDRRYMGLLFPCI